jgi:hypothetical protein
MKDRRLQASAVAIQNHPPDLSEVPYGYEVIWIDKLPSGNIQGDRWINYAIYVKPTEHYYEY